MSQRRVRDPRSMRRRALLIDAMGTLVSLEDPAPRLVALLRARAGIEVAPATARTALGAEIAHYRAHMQEGRDAAGVAALHRDCAAILRAALGVDVAMPVITEVMLAALRFAPFADARPALVRARETGARVIVVSNWDASLADVLARVGLAPLLDGVVNSAAAGARKPDGAIFERALALAGTPARDCVHVGDSPAEDVAGARAAGIAPILLDRAADADADDVEVIRSLSELDLVSRR